MANIVQISLVTLQSNSTGGNFPQGRGSSGLKYIKTEDCQKWAYLVLLWQVSSLHTQS